MSSFTFFSSKLLSRTSLISQNEMIVSVQVFFVMWGECAVGKPDVHAEACLYVEKRIYWYRYW